MSNIYNLRTLNIHSLHVFLLSLILSIDLISFLISRNNSIMSICPRSALYNWTNTLYTIYWWFAARMHLIQTHTHTVRCQFAGAQEANNQFFR